IEALVKLPDDSARTQREIGLQMSLAWTLIRTNGWAAPEVAAAVARARALGEKTQDLQQLLFVLLGLWVTPHTRGDVRAARELSEQILSAAERSGEDALRVWGHYTQGAVRYVQGDFLGAWEHFNCVLSLYRPEDHVWAPADPAVASLGQGAFT